MKLRLNHPPHSNRYREPRRDVAPPLHSAENQEARLNQVEMLFDRIRPSPAQSAGLSNFRTMNAGLYSGRITISSKRFHSFNVQLLDDKLAQATYSDRLQRGARIPMTRINSFILKMKIWKDTQGQDLIEYALMAGFVAVAAGAIMPNVATSISTIFSKIASVMTAAPSQS